MKPKFLLCSLLAAAAAGGAALHGAISDGLVTHLTFDNTLDDRSPRSHHGLAVGTITYGTGQVGSGAVNLSFKKDGSSFNYVTLGAPAHLNFGLETDFSVSFWTKFSQFVFDPPFIGNKDWTSGQYQGWMIATGTDGRLQWNYGGPPGQRKDYDGPAGTVSDGKWHHVVVTVLRAGEVLTYLDGILVDERDVSASPNLLDTPPGQATNIGQDGIGLYTDGNSVEITDLMMDDLGIWRRVLTSSEVTGLFAAGTAGGDLSTVVSSPEKPTLVRQPVSLEALAGDAVTLRVLPRGTSPFTYEWTRNDQAIPGATNATLTLNSVQAVNAGIYRVRVANAAGDVLSEPASLGVDDSQAPTLTESPLNTAAALGSRATFTVRATGVTPLTVQWLKNGEIIPNATQEIFSIQRVKPEDAGRYSARVRSGNGLTSTSTEATLSIVNDIRQGLVAHLTFDADFTDSSGRGNHGQAEGNPTLVEGRIGPKALRFSHRADGTEFNYVSLGAGTDLDFSVDSDFSFSLWVRFSQFTRDPVFVSNKQWSSGGNIGFALATGADGRFQWNFKEQVGERRDYDSGPRLIDDGQWHHLAVTFQRGGEAVAFVDGMEMNRQPLPTTGTTVSTGLPLNLGQDGSGTYTDNGTVSIMDGTMDDFAAWRRALTPEEVQGVYRSGLVGANVSEPTLVRDLVVHLPLDGDLEDRSGRGNHGTRVNNPYFVPGRIGEALDFSSNADGSSFNYVTLGRRPDLDFGRDADFTVSFWARLTNWTGDPVLIGNKNWSSGGNQGWVVATAGNGRLQWNLGDGDAGGRTRKDYDGPGGTFNDGAWHHVATVFSRQGDARTYLDGALANTTPIAADLDSIDTVEGFATNIGQDGRGVYTDNNAVGILNGQIDDVAVWRRPLAESEIVTIHQRGQRGEDLFGRPSAIDTLPNGVASGDVTTNSVVLWTRSTALGNVRFQISRGPEFSAITAQQIVAVQDPAVPAKAEFSALDAGTTYYFRALDAAGTAAHGRFKTAAAPGTRAGLRFGVSGDARGELAPFPSMGNAAARNLDFFINLGDTIYADYPSPAVPQPQARTLAEYRTKNGEVISTRLGANILADLRASTAFFVNIDDHEVMNDFAGGAPAGSDPRFGNEGQFVNESTLYRNGLQAFTEYNPIRAEVYDLAGDPRMNGKPKLYRARRFGDDAAIFLLDARSFRDEELDGPQSPTNPQQVAAFLARSFDINPANGQPLPRRTMLGLPQLEQLKADLLAAQQGGVEWKFVMVPEPIQNLGVLAASDRFEGYAAERTDLLRFAHENAIRNVVFVAADIHGTLINNLTYQLGPGQPQIPTRMWEITTGAVAFADPFGPTVLELAADVSLGSGSLLDAFLAQLGLPNLAAFNSLLTREQKDAALAALVNGQITPLGYTPLGLQDGLTPSTVEIGGAAAVFVYGWTEFNVEPATQNLRVTTYGIQSYGTGDIGSRLLQRAPEVVNEFVVAPERPTLSVERAGGGGIRLSWDASFAGYLLESAPGLGAGVVWSGVPSETESGRNSAIVTPTEDRYFRLRRP